MNPWGLTKEHQQTLDALIKHGNSKRVSTALGIGLRAVESRLLVIRDLMGDHTVGCVAAWAVWRSGEVK